MKLDEITPHRISSVLQPNWTAQVPSWIVAAAILLPALLLRWPYTWLFIAIAVVAAVATDFGMSKLRHHLRIRNAMTPPRTLPDPPLWDVAQRVKLWTEVLGNKAAVRSFVLFAHGTCVVSVDDDAEPAPQAKSLLKAFGHSIPGTPSADMLVYALPDTCDFVIGGHHPNILTFVSRDTFSSDVATEQLRTLAGFWGRELRVLDTFTLNVIHTHKINSSPN
ncbi:MAG: hypothetical protein K8T25_21665 [Planctomycetia bacterium]|nr:hypothetical protein [Planctomycetia bacterium]